jgi:methionine synthase II (cobalamin-independent)
VSSTSPIRVTGIGSWPGTDMAEAIKITFAECPDLPYLPELPARGGYAAMIGRSTALLAGLAVDLQPAGWRLTDGSGRDHRLAIATLRSDLDLLEEHAQGYVGPLKYSVAGPWTLAATMERPRGDRVLADHGARREVAQSLTEGVAELAVEMRRRLPGTTPLIQLDEPLLPAVLAGSVPTASGFSRHRSVDAPEISAALTQLGERLRAAAETDVLVHCCAADPPVDLLYGAGIRGLLVDLDHLGRTEWDAIGPALETGWEVGLGARPTNRALTADQLARRVVPALRDLGVDPERIGQLLLTPACGLASATLTEAIAALRALRSAADIVSEQLAS